MSERRLPPALERKVFNRNPIEIHGFLEGEVVLDFLGDLVERVQERAHKMGVSEMRPTTRDDVLEALRAELGITPSTQTPHIIEEHPGGEK